MVPSGTQFHPLAIVCSLLILQIEQWILSVIVPTPEIPVFPDVRLCGSDVARRIQRVFRVYIRWTFVAHAFPRYVPDAGWISHGLIHTKFRSQLFSPANYSRNSVFT